MNRKLQLFAMLSLAVVLAGSVIWDTFSSWQRLRTWRRSVELLTSESFDLADHIEARPIEGRRPSHHPGQQRRQPGGAVEIGRPVGQAIHQARSVGDCEREQGYRVSKSSSDKGRTAKMTGPGLPKLPVLENQKPNLTWG